jgi:hypothetical protein
MDDSSRNNAPNPRILAKHLTSAESAETHCLDNQASDADDEADSIYDSDTSSITEPANVNQSDHGLHKLMAKTTLGKPANDEAVTHKDEQRDGPSRESDRERLIRLLGPPPPGPPFRAPVAVMYLSDENGHYIPDDDVSAEQQKPTDQLNSEQQLTSEEEYVKIPPKEDVKVGSKNEVEEEDAKEDSDDSLGSPAVMVEAESSESDGFTKVDNA